MLVFIEDLFNCFSIPAGARIQVHLHLCDGKGCFTIGGWDLRYYSRWHGNVMSEWWKNVKVWISERCLSNSAFVQGDMFCCVKCVCASVRVCVGGWWLWVRNRVCRWDLHKWASKHNRGCNVFGCNLATTYLGLNGTYNINTPNSQTPIAKSVILSAKVGFICPSLLPLAPLLV